MKKTLLFIFLGAINFVSSQVLQSENFNGLTVGNIGANLTGTTSGQGGYFTYVASGGVLSDFQIVAEGGAYANVLQITGSNSASNTRYLWKDGLDTAWGSRTAGNDVINIEFDFFTGGASTSKNRQGVYLYNAAGDKVLVGFSFVVETKTLLGVCYLDNAGTLGNYSLNLAASPVVLTANQWVRVGMSFNISTGQVFWKGPGFYGSFNGAAAGQAPAEIDYIVTPGTSNTVASVAKFDNLYAFAAATENLLGTDDFESNDLSKITVYPNPANNILNINSLSAIKSVKFIDINGRIIKEIISHEINSQINISDLNSGIYFISIETENGTTTEKLIKK